MKTKIQRKKILTIGGATEDISFCVQEGMVVDNREDLLRQKLFAFEHGAKIPIDKLFFSFGGGAANSAINFAHLGFEVFCMASIGDDERGKQILRNLRDRKVRTKLMQISKNKSSAVSFILIGRDREHVAFVEQGAKNNLNIKEADLRAISKFDWIYLSSLSGKWEANLAKIFSQVDKRENLQIAWNPGGVQLRAGIRKLKKYLTQTSVLLLNRDEALELVVSDPEYKGRGENFFNNIKNILGILKKYGPHIVVITDGAHGAYTYGDYFCHQKANDVKKVIDTTGVGDIFNSSFVAGLEIYNGDLKKAAELGAKRAGVLLNKIGAQSW